jgi:histidine ammonia-lyase
MKLVLDGSSLTIEALARSTYDPSIEVVLSDEARSAVQRSRSAVESWIAEQRVVYGLTTGFGEFANVFIPKDKAAQLQTNLIVSHAAGMGDLLPAEVVRAMMILRANALAKGFSGIRMETLDLLIGMINAVLIPDVPSQGSVGSSGDLAPLSHLALAMIGQGMIDGRPSAEVLRENNLEPVQLQAKEGLALINGTQMMTAFGALAINRIRTLSVDALRGTDNAYDPRLHLVRPHPGQQFVAARLRDLLAGSGIRESHRANDDRVQDAYSLRCIPQVHGATRDTVDYVTTVVEREMNSATDNPLVFADDDVAIEGGNFHGQPIAITMDFLGIAVAELANISERRTERLVNNALGGLPRFLVAEGGLNSGMMIAQYTAAALVSENKVLAHPASVDSIPTSANQEDHNSMGSIAARHLWDIVGNVEKVVAIELLCAAQGVDLLRPLRSSDPLERVVARIRQDVPMLEQDRILHLDMEAVHELVVTGEIVDAVTAT